jgi:hypothetical protein
MYCDTFIGKLDLFHVFGGMIILFSIELMESCTLLQNVGVIH